MSFAPAAGCRDCERLTGTGLAPREQLTLSYAGFQPGEVVTLVMHSTPVTLGTFTADAAGVVAGDVTIPETAEEGRHTLTLSGPVSGDRVVSFRVTVPRQVDRPAADSGDPAHPALWLIGAAVAVVVAAPLALLLRRRARRAAGGSSTDRGAPLPPAAQDLEPVQGA